MHPLLIDCNTGPILTQAGLTVKILELILLSLYNVHEIMTGMKDCYKNFFLAGVILILFLGMSPLWAATDASFLSSIAKHSKEELKKLDDEKLRDAYLDVLVEIEASKTFHTTSGFSSVKEYEDYKGLLKYRYQVAEEIRSRGMEPTPAVEF